MGEWSSIVYAAVLVVACGLTWLLTGQVRSFALRVNLLDRPNERSSHTVPTPRGGGIAVVGVILLLSTVWAFVVQQALVFWVAFTGTAAMAALGLVDDRSGLSARSRLIVQLLCAVTLTFSLWDRIVDHLSSVLVPVFPVVGAVAAILFMVWMVNLYNFMDGVDGILGVQAATVSVTLAALGIVSGAVQIVPVYFAIAGSMVGFLFWNWSPARIFMGDVGSASIGFLFGALGVLSIVQRELSLAAVLVVHAAFIGDATWTLAARILQRKRVHQAHRTHLYQKLTRRSWPHSRVSVVFGAFNVLWLAPIALLVNNGLLVSSVAVGLAYVPIGFACWMTRAGWESEVTIAGYRP